FLYNVSLTGSVAVVIQDVSATASLGFLALTATGEGTLTNNRLLSLTATVELRNPIADSTNTTATGTHHLDLDVLGNAIRNGKFLWDSTLASGTGDADNPPTGFFTGTLTGGLGAKLTVKPGGILDGLSDSLSADLSITIPESTSWLPDPSNVGSFSL